MAATCWWAWATCKAACSTHVPRVSAGRLGPRGGHGRAFHAEPFHALARHRSAGDCAAFTVCNLKRFQRSTSAFRWGSQYTHFFYAVEASAPFRLLATSNEFCLGATANDTDCGAAGPNVAVACVAFSLHCLVPGRVRHAILGSIQVRASSSYLVLHSRPTATSFCRMASTIAKPGLAWSAVSACGVHFTRCH